MLAPGKSGMAEMEEGGIGQRTVAQRRAEEPEACPRRALHGEHCVFECGEIGYDRRDLETPGKAQPGAFGGAERVDGLPLEGDAAGIGAQFSGDLLDQGGLASTVRPDQRMDLARLEVERDIIRGHQRTEAPGEIAERQDRFRHRRASVSGAP